MSLLQVLHFRRRYKQTCPLSYGFVSLANGHKNSLRSCSWNLGFCLSVLCLEIALKAEREENSGRMERGSEDRWDTRHPEEREKRREEHMVTDMTKVVRNSQTNLLEVFFSAHFE